MCVCPLRAGDGNKQLLINNHVDDSSSGVFAFEIPEDVRTGVFTKHILASGFKTVSCALRRSSPPARCALMCGLLSVPRPHS